VAAGGARTSGPGSEWGLRTVGEHLVRFDELWLKYLDQFAAWKLADAASLEAELVRARV